MLWCIEARSRFESYASRGVIGAVERNGRLEAPFFFARSAALEHYLKHQSTQSAIAL